MACFMAEQSAQLYLKAVILEISGEMPRTHSIRSLLSILSTLLKKQVKYDRKSLIFLESAYINARYLGVVYEKEDAEEAVRIAEGIMELVDRVRKEEG
ncbi:MAG: HEPN domain protein [Candidatus Alkanophagales archaeon MCA70_species_1]|nr:HEPN domain protein [Candidatus Alkanophaga volatiphilum]